MQALWQAAIEPVNIFYTVLLGVIVLYWLSVFLGALDMSAFDFDVDVDADIDVDVDVDVDADIDMDGEANTTVGWFAGVLHFFNFGKLPFMILMSFVILSMWCLALLSNDYVGHGSWGFALAMFIPILFVSLIIGKIVTTPLVPIFKNLDQAVEPINYIGKICKLRLPASSSKFGQAEVNIDDDVLLIEVKTESDEEVIKRGETARVIGKTSDNKFYLIKREVIQ